MCSVRTSYTCACSVVSNSLRPYGVQPTRLLCSWDFSGKNIGVGCHFLLWGIFPTQGSNSRLLHLLYWQIQALPLSHLGNPFSSVKFLSCVQLFATPWIAACQACLSITNSQSLLTLLLVESVMPSNHLVLFCPLRLPPSIFPSIRVFSNESVLHIRRKPIRQCKYPLIHMNFTDALMVFLCSVNSTVEK